MAKSYVPITGAVLAWAVDDSEFTIPSLADRLQVEPDDIDRWISETAQPSKGQWTKLAEALRRPRAFFLLPEPPEQSSIPTAFRRAPGGTSALSPVEVNRIRWARSVQDLLAWVRKRASAATDVPEFSIDDDPVRVGNDLRTEVGIDLTQQREWSDGYRAFRAWRDVIEARGVSVLQLDLGRQRLRGFSVWNDEAPLIAVNSSSSIDVRNYTLLHEYGHLLTRTDMACTGFTGPQGGASVERWCERFAAAFLMPGGPLANVLRVEGIEPASIGNVETVRRLATRYKVSVRAMAIRLVDLGYGAPGLYEAVNESIGTTDWTPQRSGGGGESGPDKRLRQLGARPISTLIDAYYEGDITRRDLQRHLRLDDRGVDEVESLVRARTAS